MEFCLCAFGWKPRSLNIYVYIKWVKAKIQCLQLYTPCMFFHIVPVLCLCNTFSFEVWTFRCTVLLSWAAIAHKGGISKKTASMKKTHISFRKAIKKSLDKQLGSIPSWNWLRKCRILPRVLVTQNASNHPWRIETTLPSKLVVKFD